MYAIEIARASGCIIAMYGRKAVPKIIASEIKAKIGKRFVDVLCVLPRTGDAIKVQCLVKVDGD
jgi:hypothetical protein|tara:strand:+ start:3486 stop:3677 length:192 start_codon:yes stop_codon:yes gene_type:complete